MQRRAKLRVTVPAFPSTVTHAGIYVDRGATEPVLDYQNDTVLQTIDLSSFAAGGAAPPGSNNFGPGGNSEIKATNFQLLSDGAGKWPYIMPPGGIIPYGGATAPAGWLLCDGSLVSKTTYADLFAVIGHTYNGGVDPGGGNFKLPDMRQRFPLGKAASGTGATLGGTGGVVDHGHDAHTSHSPHTASSDHGTHSSGGAHAHDRHGSSSNTQGGGTAERLTGLQLGDPPDRHGSDGGHTHDSHSPHTASSDHSSHGTHAAANPPFQVFNYIIKI
jgi:microcystin-dependent protein